ncbi:class I glutamine amidotransferase-like protein [Astrocystis sublimbata]|nr:class I glutamine amidotransferase-like protein [Astrocystis sublimbata]
MSRPITFGSLLYDYQAIDVIGATDLLNSSGKQILKALRTYGPIDESTISRAPELVFHHIGLTREPVTLLTSNLTIVPTATVDDCPELDVLLLGGPNPEHFQLDPTYAEFIRRHVASGKLVFTTCTGAYVAAQAGVLDGKNATINHMEIEWVKKRFPQVKWTMEKQWMVDGNIWTGSGAVAGMDMVAHWIQMNFGHDVLTAGALGLDYEPRDIDGLFTVLPKRFDENGKQIPTHVFKYYDEY